MRKEKKKLDLGNEEDRNKDWTERKDKRKEQIE